MEHGTTILSTPHSAVLQYGVPHSTVLQYGDNSPFCSPAIWGRAKMSPESKPISQCDKVQNYPHTALPYLTGETEGQQKEISPICIPQVAYSMGKLPHSESF